MGIEILKNLAVPQCLFTLGIAYDRSKEGKVVFCGDSPGSVVKSKEIGPAALVAQIIIPEMIIRIVACTYEEVSLFLIREIPERNIDNSSREIGRQFSAEGFVNNDIIYKICRENVHLHGVTVGIKPGNVDSVKDCFRITVTKTSDEYIPSAFD